MTETERVVQRNGALAKANRTRIARANIKRDIAARSTRAGLERCADALAERFHMPEVAAMTVRELVLAVSQFGDAKAERLIRLVDRDLSVDRRVRDLSARQREALIVELRAAAQRRRIVSDYDERLVPAGGCAA